MEIKEFLHSAESGPEINDSKSNRQSLNSYLIRFKNGTLFPNNNKRKRVVVYHEIEELLLTYLITRLERYSEERVGISWLLMQEKLKEWKEQMHNQEKYSKFKASPGFIEKCLERNGISKITLHGEGAEMSLEERLAVVAEFSKELDGLIDELNL